MRFRRVPRDHADGYEVLIDGKWHSLAEDHAGHRHPKITEEVDARWENLLEDPSEQQAAEECYPDGIDLVVPR